MSLMDKLYHRRLRDFESFDRVELSIVPRYKTSGLSGDEWRQHIAVKFYFKGELVHETGFNRMRDALMLLGGEWIRAQEPIPDRIIELESTKCDQPSCTAEAVGRFELKKLTADNGEYLDMSDQYLRYYRKFCKRHLRRGDCSREDADDNYIPLDGAGPGQSTNVIESPSAVVALELESLDDLPEALRVAPQHAVKPEPPKSQGDA
jgi:hypothetical protein